MSYRRTKWAARTWIPGEGYVVLHDWFDPKYNEPEGVIPFELGAPPVAPGNVELEATYRCHCDLPSVQRFSEMQLLMWRYEDKW